MPPKRLTSALRLQHDVSSRAACRRCEPGPRPEQALAADQHQHDQEQAEPERPVLRRDRRQPVVHHLERDRADQRRRTASRCRRSPAPASRRRCGGTRARRARRSRWSAPAARRPRRPSPRRACRPPPGARCTDMPIAIARSRLSRSACSDDAERRMHDAPRDSRKATNSTDQRIARRPCGRRGRTRSGPSSGPITTPCRPSAPPVSQSSLLASSSRIRRHAQRHHQPRQVGAAQDQRAASARPAARPRAMPTARPTSGSGITCLANSAAA